MATPRLSSPRATALLAIAALGLACAVVVSDSGPNQAAHFALVRSLAAGTAEIDPRETIDAAYVDGRFYAAKAPGLALATLPWYGALRLVGLQDGTLATEAGYRHRLWELGLVGTVLPLVAILLLAYAAADRVAPGYGLPASVLLGAGTLLLPFATLFYDHVLSAALGFAAFVTLLFGREAGGGSWRSAAAGLLAGAAVVVEFPLGIVAVVLAGYAAAGAQPARRLAAYVAGVLIGIVPLLAYNTWAFGSPFRLSYTNALEAPAGTGAPVVGANDEGFYGVGLPDPRAALSLLFSEKGLVVVTPLAVVALAGLPLLWRSGRRAETLVCGGIPLLFLAYNAAYYLPFGGQGPGPRFLVPALPFLALPLALALRARPLLVAGVGVASAAVMVLATSTDPQTGVEHGLGLWFDELRASSLTSTVAGDGWLPVLLFVLLVVGACWLALARLPFGTHVATDALPLVGVLVAWVVLALTTPELLPADPEHGTATGALAVVVLAAALGIALWLVTRRRALALGLIAAAMVLAAPRLDARPNWSLLVAAIVLLAAVVALWRVQPKTRRLA